MLTSIQINKGIIDDFISDPNFTYLISFPRTGSHWLRMIMELYFRRPSLVRVFYYKDANGFTCYHRHDEDLQIERKNVIYLYRNPVDTIYSQINYYKEDSADINRIIYWIDLYSKHLQKWLFDETFTEKKTILTYEGMQKNIEIEFKKVCDHLLFDFNIKKLNGAVVKITKNEVKNRTTHDPQVINNSKKYKLKKNIFVNKYGGLILDKIISSNSKFENIFI